MKLADLDINKKYKVIRLEERDGRFGKCVAVLLKNGASFYLPGRAGALLLEDDASYITYLNKKTNLGIVYLGASEKSPDVSRFELVYD